MIAPRRILLGLVALANTAIWAALLHFGGRLIGMPLGALLLAGLSAGIFLLTLFFLSMTSAASESDAASHRGDDDRER
jgi:uncharacterized membrane protein